MKLLITLGSLILLAGIALSQLHLVGSTAAAIVMSAGAALMLGGAIKKRIRPGDVKRSGWSGS